MCSLWELGRGHFSIRALSKRRAAAVCLLKVRTAIMGLWIRGVARTVRVYRTRNDRLGLVGRACQCWQPHLLNPFLRLPSHIHGRPLRASRHTARVVHEDVLQRRFKRVGCMVGIQLQEVQIGISTACKRN